MGMAASQARLLTITARLADNELRSQTINNAKMRLATESAQASDDYITALNNARMMFRNIDLTGTSQTQLLTFNSLTAFSPYNTQYGLVNSAGLLLVSEDEAKIFEKSNNILEKFLENHGLKWDTTYFEEDKNVIDRLKSYYGSDEFKLHQLGPNPTQAEQDAFDNDPGLSFLFDRVDENGNVNELTSEALRELYETYLSKDVSIERASFNTAQSQYTAQKRALYSNAIQDIWDKLGTTKIDEIVKDMRSNHNNVTNGDQALTYLNNHGISFYSTGTDSFYEWARSLNVQSSTPSGGSWSNYIELDPAGSPPSDFNTGQKGTGDYANCTIYEVGTLKFYVEDNGNVKGVESTYEPESDEKVKYTVGSFTNKELNSTSGIQPITGTWPDIVNNFVENGTGLPDGSKFQESYSLKNGNIVSRTYYPDASSAQDDMLAEFISNLTSNYNSLDLDAYVDAAGTQYAQTYKDNRNEFYKLIFEDYPFDPEAMNNDSSFSDFKNGDSNGNLGYKGLFGDVDGDTHLTPDQKDKLKAIDEHFSIDSMQSLSDFTIFLQYIHEYQSATGGEPKFTSAFQNIIDAFTVELMIDELGEPKFAWVDESDKSLNQENADAKAQWYENLFNRMRKGYAVIEDGLASSADWIEHAFEAGIVTMEQVDKSYNWVSLDYKCCASITEDTDNSAAVAIAEAKYNRAMNDIKRKDNMYDMQLKNIDTEHNALQTEYDVIKGVIAKNIERTMKFDQSA